MHFIYLFAITQYNSDVYKARTLILWTHVYKLYPYEHLRSLSQQILEIGEATTGVSLSTGTSTTSPITESITPLNPITFAPMGSQTQDLRWYWSSNIKVDFTENPYFYRKSLWNSLIQALMFIRNFGDRSQAIVPRSGVRQVSYPAAWISPGEPASKKKKNTKTTSFEHLVNLHLDKVTLISWPWIRKPER